MLATRDETWASELQPVLVTLWLRVFYSSCLSLHPVFARQLRTSLGTACVRGSLSIPEAASRMDSGTFQPCGLAKGL